MTKKNKEVSINFQIIAVDVVEFNLFACDSSLLPLNTFHFNINLSQGFFPNDKLVIATPFITILHENKETILGSIKINCIFKIEELAEYYNNNTKKVTLPEAIVTTLNSVSLSTCRGVMATLFKGTILHNAVLPLLDPKNFTIDKSVKK